MKFVPCKDDQLQIDLDISFHCTIWLEWQARFRPCSFWPIEARASRNGNTHITVALPGPMPIKQRIILAAGLGDDPTRVRLNMERSRNRSPHPILFFEK